MEETCSVKGKKDGMEAAPADVPLGVRLDFRTSNKARCWKRRNDGDPDRSKVRLASNLSMSRVIARLAPSWRDIFVRIGLTFTYSDARRATLVREAKLWPDSAYSPVANNIN